MDHHWVQKRGKSLVMLLIRLAQDNRPPHTVDPLVRNGPAGILNMACLLVRSSRVTNLEGLDFRFENGPK